MKKGYPIKTRTLAIKLKSYQLTYAQISEAMGISIPTLVNWMRAAGKINGKFSTKYY